MLDSLILSNPRRKKTQGISGTLMSAVVHGVVIWTAVVVTANPVDVQAVTGDATTIVFPPALPLEKSPREDPASRQIVQIEPLPEGFRTVPPVIHVPDGIPPINAREIFDPRDYLGIGVEGGALDGIPGGPTPADSIQPFLVATVDEAPERIGGLMPQYPDMLRQAAVEGTVLLEFVIDTTGRVEPGSIVVISASHRAFEGPALDATLRSRYRPGRVRGEPVRVRVRQSVAFTIQ